MQQSFLKAFELAQNMNAPATGLWLLHGDEPLLPQWLIERFRSLWQSASMSVSRMDITSSKSWQEVLGELNSLSLFDDKKVIITQGNHKPDKDSLAQLQTFAEQNNDNCLVVLMDKIDKKNQKTAFFQVFAERGHVIDCQLYQEKQRFDILNAQATNFGIALSQNAWQQLMHHTEHNLLSAYQTLWRLSFLYNPAFGKSINETVMLDEMQLQDGLVSQSHFTTFDLSDAMLGGDGKKVVDILNHLKHAEEPESLVLWVIAKDVRALQGLLSGQNFTELGIWQNKQGLYQNALNRHFKNATDFGNWTAMLYQCDQAIKGLVQQPAWELLYQLALSVAGVKLFRQI